MTLGDVLVGDYLTDGKRLMEVVDKHARESYGLAHGKTGHVAAFDCATFQCEKLDQSALASFRLVVPATA